MKQGIYIHIPFCRKACHYCNFHFSTLLKYQKPVLKAMLSELEFQKDFLKSPDIDTIYFGGGTPSILSLEELEAFLSKIRQSFLLNPNTEITLEANPDDLTKSYLQGLQQMGINRLSIGIQSFDDKVLKWMNRSHDARQAKQALELASMAGFENLNADLIYGIPGTGKNYWAKQLSTLLRLKPAHISAYALTVEPQTVLGKRVKRHSQKEAADEQIATDYELLCQMTRHANYRHYEISNFALPGCESVHNSKYWKAEPYLGIGPGAHSFRPGLRQWNIANNNLYVNKIKAGESWYEGETLSKMQQLNEYLMTRLRTRYGIHPVFIANTWGLAEKNRIINILKEWLRQGLVQKDSSYWRLNEKAWLIADRLISDLFTDEIQE